MERGAGRPDVPLAKRRKARYVTQDERFSEPDRKPFDHRKSGPFGCGLGKPGSKLGIPHRCSARRAGLPHQKARNECLRSHSLGAGQREAAQDPVNLPVFWTLEADADVQQARTWYGNIRPELGERFATAVAATVAAIAESPLRFPDVYRGHRRAGVRRFPYGIFFDVQERRILVIACSMPSAIPRDGRLVSDTVARAKRTTAKKPRRCWSRRDIPQFSP